MMQKQSSSLVLCLLYSQFQHTDSGTGLCRDCSHVKHGQFCRQGRLTCCIPAWFARGADLGSCPQASPSPFCTKTHTPAAHKTQLLMPIVQAIYFMRLLVFTQLKVKSHTNSLEQLLLQLPMPLVTGIVKQVGALSFPFQD